MSDSIIPIRLDLTLKELDDLLSALAAWNLGHSGKRPDEDDVGRPDLGGASAREDRIGDLYQRFGAILPEFVAERPLRDRTKPLQDSPARATTTPLADRRPPSPDRRS